MKKKILIIGSVPPPVGGVTVHVKRLLEHLTLRGVAYDFFPLRQKSLFWLPLEILRHKVIHIHSSNILFYLLIGVFCKFFRKKLIITKHGNILLNSGLKLFLDIWSMKLAYQPIVLNKSSYEVARKYNPRTVLGSAFFPELHTESLPEDVSAAIQQARQTYKKVFTVVASDLAFDNRGREIYGVSSVVELFAETPSLFLVAVVGFERYREYLLQHTKIPQNVFVIARTIPFMTLLKYVDGMIRNTVTDGDSVSVREGLFANVPVFATDCVSRPDGTIVYHSTNDLKNLLYIDYKAEKEENEVDFLAFLLDIYEQASE